MRVEKLRSAALVFAAAAVLLSAAVQAHAAVPINPVNWSFDVTTTGADVFWTSPNDIEPDWPQYDYAYEITGLWGNFNIFGDVSLIDLLPEADRTGSGSGAGPCPIVLADDSFTYPDTAPYQVAADIYMHVDANGTCHVDVTGVVLGSVPIFGQLNSVRVAGDVDVTGVPEPMSILLLACGALGFVARRRKE